MEWYDLSWVHYHVIPQPFNSQIRLISSPILFDIWDSQFLALLELSR
jgi:hypothetical protein